MVKSYAHGTSITSKTSVRTKSGASSAVRRYVKLRARCPDAIGCTACRGKRMALLKRYAQFFLIKLTHYTPQRSFSVITVAPNAPKIVTGAAEYLNPDFICGSFDVYLSLLLQTDQLVRRREFTLRHLLQHRIGHC